MTKKNVHDVFEKRMKNAMKVSVHPIHQTRLTRSGRAGNGTQFFAPLRAPIFEGKVSYTDNAKPCAAPYFMS